MSFRVVRPYRFIVSLFLAAVITLGFVGNTTIVLAVDEDFFVGNNITYYNPDAGCATGSSSLTGGSTREKVWNFLTGKGLSAEQAAGIMGNMKAESGVNPTRHQSETNVYTNGGSGNAWGLVQWDGGRRFSSPKGGVLGKLREKKPELEKYTALEYDTARHPEADIPAADLDALLLFELDYMYEESQNRRVTEHAYGTADNEWETLKLQKSVDDATVFWHNNFEVSADSPGKVLQNRGGFAHEAFEEFSGKSGSPVSSTSCASADSALKLKKTVLEYAWPDKGHAPMDMKPEYRDAVIKAQSEGKYVGGCGGIDCGAFVTLLIVNSGFDPNYNGGGVYSEGAGDTRAQAAWAAKNWDSTTLGRADKIDVKQLQPGDVAISSAHTFVYVGDIPNFDSKIASASLCERTPVAGGESLVDGTFTWYRKK